MKIKLNDLKKKPIETVFIQGRVKKELVERVKALMKAKNLRWPQVLEACLKSIVEG